MQQKPSRGALGDTQPTPKDEQTEPTDPPIPVPIVATIQPNQPWAIPILGIVVALGLAAAWGLSYIGAPDVVVGGATGIAATAAGAIAGSVRNPGS